MEYLKFIENLSVGTLSAYLHLFDHYNGLHSYFHNEQYEAWLACVFIGLHCESKSRRCSGSSCNHTGYAAVARERLNILLTSRIVYSLVAWPTSRQGVLLLVKQY